jgi:hypothetical protein
MARSGPSPTPRFGTTAVAARTALTRDAGTGFGYSYWPEVSPLATESGRRRRTTTVARDVLAPDGEPPIYYGIAWQILLWLATAVLALLMLR